MMSNWSADELPEATTDMTVLKRDLHRFGYCLVRDALEPELLAAASQRLREQADAERARDIEFKNPGHLDNQWVNMLINKGVVFEKLVTNPIGTTLIEAVLGEEYVLSCCDAQIKHPGSGFMPLHTDQWWMPQPIAPDADSPRVASFQREQSGALEAVPCQPLVSPAASANVMWMITDFSRANGATVVVPGSHRSGLQPDQSVPHKVATVSAEGPAGTAIVFDGRLWHAAGENTTSQTRYGVTCDYCGPQFRQLENYTLGLRPEVMARASPRLLRLLGFKAWSTYGHTGDPDVECSPAGDQTIGELR